MRSEIINWVTPYLESVKPYFEGVMSYLARWDKLTTMEYGIIAAGAIGAIIAVIVLWKLYRVVEFYLHRRYQLLGWQENRGKPVEQ
jgi:hypothetical protein